MSSDISSVTLLLLKESNFSLHGQSVSCDTDTPSNKVGRAFTSPLFNQHLTSMKNYTTASLRFLYLFIYPYNPSEYA